MRLRCGRIFNKLLHCTFPGDCDSEIILKIGQYLMKLCVEYRIRGLLFVAHSVVCTNNRFLFLPGAAMFFIEPVRNRLAVSVNRLVN